MRIIAGRLGGRRFSSPHAARTHPMSDKIRGAIFNALGDVGDLTVLDAFAGSGALGFEAISRGARSAILIESDRSAQRSIDENIDALGIRSQVKLVKASCSGWSDNNPENRFDIVLSDPPFDHLQLAVLQKLVRHVAPDGLYILNWPGKTEPPQLNGLEAVDIKSYGDAQLIFFR